MLKKITLLNNVKLTKIKKISFAVICTLFIYSKLTFANELLVSSNGIKLGDSLLKYIPYKDLIEKHKKFYYKSKDYFMVGFKNEEIHVRNNDPQYTIVSINEGLNMSFEKCKKEKTEPPKEKPNPKKKTQKGQTPKRKPKKTEPQREN